MNTLLFVAVLGAVVIGDITAPGWLVVVVLVLAACCLAVWLIRALR